MTQTGSVADRLSDWISLGVLASWVPRDAVDEAVEATGRTAKRKGGKLPPHVMVYFAMALALLADEDYEEVWTRLTGTLSDWGRLRILHFSGTVGLGRGRRNYSLDRRDTGSDGDF